MEYFRVENGKCDSRSAKISRKWWKLKILHRYADSWVAIVKSDRHLVNNCWRERSGSNMVKNWQCTKRVYKSFCGSKFNSRSSSDGGGNLERGEEKVCLNSSNKSLFFLHLENGQKISPTSVMIYNSYCFIIACRLK